MIRRHCAYFFFKKNRSFLKTSNCERQYFKCTVIYFTWVLHFFFSSCFNYRGSLTNRVWPGPSRCLRTSPPTARRPGSGPGPRGGHISRRAGTTASAPDRPDPGLREPTKGAVKCSGRKGLPPPGRMGNPAANQPRAGRPCPRSELSLCAPG